MDTDKPSFPTCVESENQFAIDWVLYGPLCLLSTGIFFVIATFYDWEDESLYERVWAVIVCIALILGIWIILPLFIVLELIKFLCFPVGLLTYILTKKYYESYPPLDTSSRTHPSSSFSIRSGQVPTNAWVRGVVNPTSGSREEIIISPIETLDLSENASYDVSYEVSTIEPSQDNPFENIHVV